MKNSPKLKHLTFNEMWKLYNLLRTGMEKRKQEKYLIDEVNKILDGISMENYLNSLSLLYGNQIIYNKLDAITSLNLFIDGLKINKFLEFCIFKKGLDGSS